MRPVFTFLTVMRYGFPVALAAAAVIVLVAVVYRLSVSSEVERDEEDEARAYLCGHGQWPDETPQEPQKPLHRDRVRGPAQRLGSGDGGN